MKKIIILFSILTSILLITACGNKANASAEIAPKIDPNVISFAFQSNPTTGYAWAYSLLEGDQYAALELDAEAYESDDQTGKLMGAGGISTFKFKAIKKGEQELTFRYVRDWDPESAIYEVVYKLNVDESLKTTCVDKTVTLNEGNANPSIIFPEPTYE